MNRSFPDVLEHCAQLTQALTGAHFVWKDADPGLRYSLPRSVAMHTHPGCLKEKRGDSYDACSAWCAFPGRPALGHGVCHAGFSQWRWAINDSVGLMGHLCLGPFSSQRRDLGSAPGEDVILSLRQLLELVITGAADSRRQLLGDLGPAVRHPSLKAVIHSLAQRPDHGDRAADLATRAHISTSRLQHLCREELGLSLRELQDGYLLSHARRLLLAPDQAPVQLIAKQLGFRDQRRFATWFRRQSAMSPTEFRKARPV